MFQLLIRQFVPSSLLRHHIVRLSNFPVTSHVVLGACLSCGFRMLLRRTPLRLSSQPLASAAEIPPHKPTPACTCNWTTSTGSYNSLPDVSAYPPEPAYFR